MRSEGDRTLRWDAAVAVLVAVVSVVLVFPALVPFARSLGIRVSGPQQTVVLVTVVVQSLILAVRRLAPVACLVVVVAAQVVLAVVLPPDTFLRGIPTFVAAYTVGTLLPPARLPYVVGGAALVDVVGGGAMSSLVGPGVRDALRAPDTLARLGSGEQAVNGLVALLSWVAAAAVGAWVAARRDQLRTARLRAEELDQQQRARVYAAVADERVRMARELHDIAAHHLSGLVVQAAAAERLVDRDPAEAKDAIRGLRRQGRDALDNLRVAVGVLRDTGAPRDRRDAGGPTPGLGALGDLVAASRDAGDDLRLTVLGDPRSLPPVADTTAYRVAQEAVANARRHAPGAPVDLVVDHRGGGVRLEVVNGAPTTPSTDDGSGGFGLVGMRERADLLGATLETGPTEDGGWRVRLDLPAQR